MSDFVELRTPTNLTLDRIYNGPKITPLQQLSLMDDSQFEELTEVWAHGKIGDKYKKVKRFAGPGDKGRDIVGYYDDNNLSKIDIYQCKHYKDQLTITNMLKEFTKLCYYTFTNRYPIPENYYIVSSKGCGPTLRTDFIDKPTEINSKLCEYIISSEVRIEKVKLSSVDNFFDWVKNFNFSIVKEITQQDLIDDFWNSKYRPYYFGGGLDNFIFQPAPPNKPDSVQKEEENYVNQLLEVYSESKGFLYSSIDDLNPQFKNHFEMQRTYYYTIESFRTAVRDSLPSLELFDETEEIIHQGVNDIIINPFLNGYQRLDKSLERAVNMNLDACKLKNYLRPNDKKGVCHRLANSQKVRWVMK